MRRAALFRGLFAGHPALSLGPDPLFAVPAHAAPDGVTLLSSVPVGLIAGLLALVLTMAVYAAEDAFQHLPIHWMWWPAIGGLAVGIGGYFEPRALGVGYANIEHLLAGNYFLWPIVTLIVVKGLIWSTSLGSGTSGGVLAPLLTIGAALGAIEHTLGLPGGDKTLWPLISMAAVMGGTMRSPLTGVLFALELTHDVNALLPLLIACTFAHGLTVLAMKRSILTEKVARRVAPREPGVFGGPARAVESQRHHDDGAGDGAGVHAGAEPARAILPRRRFPASSELPGRRRERRSARSHHADEPARGMGRRGARSEGIPPEPGHSTSSPSTSWSAEPITAFPWESARVAAERMWRSTASAGSSSMDPHHPTKPVGIVTRSDLLKSRARVVEAEGRRERVIGKGFRFPFWGSRA